MDQTPVLVFIVNLVLSAAAGAIAASIRIGVYKNKVDNLETTVGKDEHAGLRKTVGDVRDKVVACETSLKEREPLTKKRSPVSLSDRGEMFLKSSGGEQFVNEHFDELLKNIEERNPQTAYDVQIYAEEAIKGLHDDERLNPLKEFLFKDGSSMDDLTVVMGIYLRDKILKYKQWNVSNIDKYKHGTSEITNG